MIGEVLKYERRDGKRKVTFSIILIFLITSILLNLPTLSSAKPSGDTVYVSADGSGDFSCDGSDDQIEINKALAYVAENPEFTTVHLRGPNTYVISNSIFIGSNTVLEGDSTAVIKLKDKAGWRVDKPLITQMDSAGNQNITIKGFEIDGNHDKNNDKRRGKGYYNLMYFVNSKNIQVHDLYMHNSHGDGLKVSRSSNIQFYNNTVHKLGHDALYIIHSSNLEAWNNSITCRTNSGLRIYNTNHVKFNNNLINSEGEGGAGIEIQKSDSSTIMDDIEIYNNLLHETNTAGIWMTGYGPEYSKGSAKDVYIHHNKFYKTGIDFNSNWAGGIVLNGFQNTLIENNIFDGCYGAAIAHKEVTNEFSAPSSGYTTIVKNNIIINTEVSFAAGKGYAIYNKLKNTHSFILENNCFSNNAGGNYVYASSTSDVEVDPGYVEQVSKNESMKKDFPWSEALSAGPQRPYQIEENRTTPTGQEESFVSSLRRDFLNFIRSLRRFFLNIFIEYNETENFYSNETENFGSNETENFRTISPVVVSDNRLKEESPTKNFRESEYIDIGEKSDAGTYRDVILFELNSFNNTDNIEKATLSLFWYYPEGQKRANSTVLEVYRPEKWCEEYVTWNEREFKIPWNNSGGDWYDQNGILQGNTPYATIIISGDQIPEKRYYELNVTKLVQEYVNGKYENSGFLIKAREEDDNYIAFYSSNWKNTNQRPKLIVDYS